MNIQVNAREAYQLMFEGAKALGEVSQNGIRVDVDYCERQQRLLDKQIARLELRVQESDEVKMWREIYKDNFNLDSVKQLGDILYNHLKLTPPKMTGKDNPSVDKTSLESLNVGFIKDLLESRKLKKLKNTYLSSIIRETVDGFMHPFFNLHLVQTYRSCIAKGMRVDTVRDVSKYPHGIPIEDVKIGDYVYSYDDNLKPCIKKVLWAGKTGTREVIRVHWKSSRGKTGYLDCTSEHRIRLSNGEYVQAKDLKLNTSVLGLSRNHDKLYFTRYAGKHNSGIFEHRFIYEQLIEGLSDDYIIHHKDDNHLNHLPNNLVPTTKKEHAKIHFPNGLPKEARNKGSKKVQEMEKLGLMRHLKGEECPNFIPNRISKFSLLRLLARNKYKVKELPFDFNSVKKAFEYYGINMDVVKSRLNGKKQYISPVKIKSFVNKGLGFNEIRLETGMTYPILKRNLQLHGINLTRRWANQVGPFIPHNHRIVTIEHINKVVDVYDIEVENTHNFVVEGIVAHNSGDHPNFQNMPIRDKDAGRIIRSAIIPRKGQTIIGADYSGIEVRAASWYHKDPVMLSYIQDPSKDMHRDMASQIYMLTLEETSKEARFAAKNGFVFPEFYGDYWRNCAKTLWDFIASLNLKVKGTDIPLKTHLKSKGIKNLTHFENHLQRVENDFWNNRFMKYQEWKDIHVEKYEKNGYVDLLTGFRCQGIMSRNQVINYPVQGVAFHCLLWSLIQIHNTLKKEKWETKIIGQIHDELVADVHPDEKDDYLMLVEKIMCRDIKEHWPFIITKLDVEATATPIDGNWFLKKVVPIPEFKLRTHDE